VNENWNSIQGEELFWLRSGHACTEACRWKNCEYLHNSPEYTASAGSIA